LLLAANANQTNSYDFQNQRRSYPTGCYACDATEEVAKIAGVFKPLSVRNIGNIPIYMERLLAKSCADLIVSDLSAPSTGICISSYHLNLS